MIKNICLLVITLLLGMTQVQAVYAQQPATPAAALVSTNTLNSQQAVNASCTTDYESALQSEAIQNIGPGKDIINGIFTQINTILSHIGQAMFTAIATNPDYKAAVATSIFLYITVYGIMISFNIASFQTAEVTSRLIKIAIVLTCLSPNAWALFNQFVATPVLNIMNGMIESFSAAATVNGGPSVLSNAMGITTGTGKAATVTPTLSTPTLSTAAMTMLMGPMTLVYSLTFVVMIITLLFTGLFGWVYAFFLIWAFIEFTTMIIAALITYVKAMIALTFLFSLAPIFFAFLLFERTRQVFKGWLNQVLGFAIQPILMFAFLGFYGQMLLEVLQDVMFVPGVMYCKRKFISLGIVDIYWWRPVVGNATGDGDYNPANPSPVHIESILLLLAVTHLGKGMEVYLSKLGETFTGAGGQEMLRGAQVGKSISNHIPGAGGRGPGGIVVDTVSGWGDNMQRAWNNRSSQRRTTITTQTTTSHQYSDADGNGKRGNRQSANTNRQGNNTSANQGNNASQQSQNRESHAHYFSDAGGSENTSQQSNNSSNTENTSQNTSQQTHNSNTENTSQRGNVEQVNNESGNSQVQQQEGNTTPSHERGTQAQGQQSSSESGQTPSSNANAANNQTATQSSGNNAENNANNAENQSSNSEKPATSNRANATTKTTTTTTTTTQTSQVNEQHPTPKKRNFLQRLFRR